MTALKDGQVVRKMTFQHGRSKITVSARDVGPKTAKKFLATNSNFRRENETRTKLYADTIESGDWTFNGDTIAFDDLDRLINGQHRLGGVVRSGKTVRMLIVRGITSEGDRTIDTGAKRNVADYLSHMGEKSCTALAAALRIIYCAGHNVAINSLKRQFTVKQAMHVLKENPEIREWIAKSYAAKPLRMPTSAMAAIMYLMSRKSKRAANKFFDELVTGENLSKGDPLLTFRNFCFSHADKPTTLRPDSIYYAGFLIKVWNARRSGQMPKSLKWHQTGPRAEPFPRIK